MYYMRKTLAGDPHCARGDRHRHRAAPFPDETVLDTGRTPTTQQCFFIVLPKWLKKAHSGAEFLIDFKLLVLRGYWVDFNNCGCFEQLMNSSIKLQYFCVRQRDNSLRLGIPTNVRVNRDTIQLIKIKSTPAGGVYYSCQMNYDSISWRKVTHIGCYMIAYRYMIPCKRHRATPLVPHINAANTSQKSRKILIPRWNGPLLVGL